MSRLATPLPRREVRASARETNIFAAILVDNSRGGMFVSELSLEHDGAFVEE